MHHPGSYTRDLRIQTARVFLFTLVVVIPLCVSAAWADTWVCSRAGQPDLYTDRDYPGCKPLGEAKTYSPLEIIPAPQSSRSATVTPPLTSTPTSPAPARVDYRKPLPFPETSFSFPVLAVGGTQAGAITGSWIGLVARLSVSYRADGKGPKILTDGNLRPTSAHSFQTALEVATKAVGYDPKYLTVRLLVPTSLDGPSAGGIFAVAIASALLGDHIRSDICMSGTIEPDEEIQAVGRLVDKMSACRDLRKTTMIVPDALDNSHLNFTGAERAIQVIEVHTLAEAYSAATGQSLRPVLSQ